MSALLMVLPRVWARADGDSTEHEVRQPLALVASRLHSDRQPFVPGERKGPHGLRVVASAAPALESKPCRPILLRKQQASVNGVAYEFYRRYTEAMLGRYMKLSMEAGRVPSMLGRELFRGPVTSYKVHSFEDVSNFVHDIDRCLSLLDPGQRHLVRRIALEQYTQEETAALLGMSLRTVVRRYREAIDRLTRTLLERGLMQPLSPDDLNSTASAGKDRGVEAVKGVRLEATR